MAEWQTAHCNTAGQQQRDTETLERERKTSKAERLGKESEEKQRKVSGRRKEESRCDRTEQVKKVQREKKKKGETAQREKSEVPRLFVYFLTAASGCGESRTPQGPIAEVSADMPAVARVHRFPPDQQKISRAQIILRSE